MTRRPLWTHPRASVMSRTSYGNQLPILFHWRSVQAMAVRLTTACACPSACPRVIQTAQPAHQLRRTGGMRSRGRMCWQRATTHLCGHPFSPRLHRCPPHTVIPPPCVSAERRGGGGACICVQHSPLPERAAPVLLSAVDGGKDQSDFLATVPREGECIHLLACAIPTPHPLRARRDRAALRRVMFPVGGLHKRRLREMAAHAGLPTATRRDSYGICFVGKRTLGSFLGQYALALAAGRMVEAESMRDVGECACAMWVSVHARCV